MAAMTATTTRPVVNTTAICPACNGTRHYQGPLGTLECAACSGWWGVVTGPSFRQICRGGWSEADFDQSRYVNLDVVNADTGDVYHVHGWIDRNNGKWIQVG